jgi:hypothetical protein
VKPGDLERNLARLVAVARAAEARLVTAEGEVVALRHALRLPSPLLVAVDGGPEPHAKDRASAALEAVSMEAAFK